jgi:hypothetical protein
MEEAMRWSVLTFALLLLCACAEVEPPGRSTEEFVPNTGANEIIDNLMLRNAFVIGGAAGRPLTPGSSVPLYLTLVNERDQTDELVSLTAAPLFSGATVGGRTCGAPGRARRRRTGASSGADRADRKAGQR